MSTQLIEGGLGTLIEEIQEGLSPNLVHVPPEAIDPNPTQPRQEFDAKALEELTESIARHGVLQPLIVRRGPSSERYEIVAGERRLRAALKLGIPTVPCLIADVPDDRLLEIALVENLQREDLDPIEVANAYRTLMSQCNYTQEELARRLAVGRSTVTNALRLLELPTPLRKDVSRGTLTMGHARAIAAIPSEPAQQALAARVARDGLTVRETEAEVAKWKSPRPKPRHKKRPSYISEIEDRLRKRLGTKVAIKETGSHRGRISIEFYSEDDFERLLALFD